MTAIISRLRRGGTTGEEKLSSNNRTRLISCDKKNFPPCFSSRVNKLFQHEEDRGCEWGILNYPWNIIYLELSFSRFSFHAEGPEGGGETFQICSQKHIRFVFMWIGKLLNREVWSESV